MAREFTSINYSITPADGILRTFTLDTTDGKPTATAIDGVFSIMKEEAGPKWATPEAKKKIAREIRALVPQPTGQEASGFLDDPTSGFLGDPTTTSDFGQIFARGLVGPVGDVIQNVPGPENIESLRTSALATGALVGGVIGGGGAAAITGGTGTIPGAILGSSLGTGIASSGFDLVKDIGRRTGLVGKGGIIADAPDPEPFSASLFDSIANIDPRLDSALRATEEMAFEIIVPGILKTAGRGLLAGGRKIADVLSEASLRIGRAARRLNISVPIETISQSGAVRRIRRVFGRFPLMDRPFVKSNREVGGQLREVKDKMLHEVSPVITTITESGLDLSTAQIRRQKAASGVFSRLYESLMTRAEDAGARIPTERTREMAQDLVNVWRRNMPKKIVEKKTATGITTTKEPIKSITDPKIIDFADKQLTNLAPDMTPRQYQRLSIEFNALIDEVGDNPALKRQAVLLKDALLKDLESINDPVFRQEIIKLNAKFSSWMRLLDSPTGKRFGRASSGIFNAERQAGTQNADVMFNTFFNAKSPTAMKELKALVGTKQFRRAVRTHIDDAFENAREPGRDEVVYNLNKIRKNLGLGQKNSPEYQTLRVALEEADTGVRISNLDDYFEVAEAQFKLGVVNVSDFIARRAQLSGLKGVIRALPGLSLTGGGGAAGAGGAFLGGASGVSILFAASVFLSIRGTSKLITNPRWLKTITELGGRNISDDVRRRAYTRGVRLLLEEAGRMDAEAVSGISRDEPGNPNQEASARIGLGRPRGLQQSQQ